MKFLTVLACLTSSIAFAQVCKSSLVYRNYNSCASLDNGIKTSEGKVVVPAGAPQIVTTEGGHNLDDECEKVRKVYDRNDDVNHMAYRGAIVEKKELKPVEHRSDVGNFVLSVDYKYSCSVEVRQIPYAEGPAKVCGVASQWQKAQPGVAREAIHGDVKCLSCDDVKEAPAALACIAETVNSILGKVTVDDNDLAAIQWTIHDLIRYQRVYKTFDLHDADLLAEISDKIEALEAADH